MSPRFITNIEGSEEPLRQGTQEWRDMRMGKATASNFHRIVTEMKGDYAATADQYAREVAVQRVLAEDTEKPISGLYWVERGKLLEADAVKHYETLPNRRTTNAIGLIISEDGTRACSPDRISADRLWGVEIKCLSGAEHLAYMKTGPEKKYRWQVLGSILVADFEGWELLNYHPKLREVVTAYKSESHADELKKLDGHLRHFEEDVQAYCELIRREGIVEPVMLRTAKSNEEWQKLLKADPNLWVIA